MLVLICVGVVCLLVCATNSQNEKEKAFNASEECKDVTDIERSLEKQCKAEEQRNDDIWEIEHVQEIGFRFNESITQGDVTQIGRFIHLKHLNISIDESGIDLSPLRSLVELESLDMDIQDGCSPDLSFVIGLSHLEKLDITVGKDVDLTPLGNLTGLRHLSISTWSGDELDLSFIKKLSCVEEITIAKCCAVDDLSVFQNISSMRELDVAYVADVDLCYLANLKNLESLAIIGENIRNPEGLSKLLHLKSLSLYDNSLDAMYDSSERELFDLQAFANLSKLEWLDLNYVNIEDISPLSQLRNLRQISLIKTNVRDISPLMSLDNLDKLYLFGNNSKLIKEQAEMFLDEVEDVIVTEEIPSGL